MKADHDGAAGRLSRRMMLAGGLGLAASAAGSAAFAQKAAAPPVIDFHTHIIDVGMVPRTVNHSVVTGFGAKPFTPPPPNTTASAFFSKSESPQRHIEDMDAQGVDIHIVSPTGVYNNVEWAPAAECKAMTEELNNYVAAWCAARPDRLKFCCGVPLNYLDIAIAELERCTSKLGARVVVVPAQADGEYLGHPRFWPFWEAALRLNVTVFIHPEGVTDPWYQRYNMWNSIGQSIEEVKVMTSMIYEGLWEKMPGLKVVVAHGGGYMPHYMGRLDRNAAASADVRKNLTKPPSGYLRNFYYDTCVYDQTTLTALIRAVGTDRLVMGGDYPIGERNPVAFVKTMPSLARKDVQMILGGNAVRLTGLSRAA